MKRKNHRTLPNTNQVKKVKIHKVKRRRKMSRKKELRKMLLRLVQSCLLKQQKRNHMPRHQL